MSTTYCKHENQKVCSNFMYEITNTLIYKSMFNIEKVKGKFYNYFGFILILKVLVFENKLYENTTYTYGCICFIETYPKYRLQMNKSRISLIIIQKSLKI